MSATRDRDQARRHFATRFAPQDQPVLATDRQTQSLPRQEIIPPPNAYNNLAFAFGQKAIWVPSYYVGSFGEYDMGAVRDKRSAP